MKKRICLVFAFLSILTVRSFTQEDKFKALYMYNFTKYLEWPASKQSGDFIIGVYGSSPIIGELEIISQKSKIGNRNLVVKKIATPDEMEGCNIAYFPTDKSSKAAELYMKFSGSGVVLITDKPGMAKEISCINYIMKDGKQQFEINKSNIEKQGVKVNSVLMTLGIVVN